MRESCAQTLGVVMKYLESQPIRGVTTILLQLLKQQQWEVRHGGLLGMKYLLAVRRVGIDLFVSSPEPKAHKVSL